MVAFSSPSFRAASSDLTIAISPLGLVELADEEFEVHGPRLNRYAQAWAFYLGHHWSYTREAGEPQVTLNYVRAFSDYINNFLMGRGVTFHAPKETEAIVPRILKRVWENDNAKMQILWEIGNMGGVSGDAFIKIAYEDPFVDSVGRIQPGRVRIIPINSSYAFPEWHPHDRTRLMRFKMKYKFWGTSLEGTRQVFCLDDQTEFLTDAGWRKWDEVEDDERFLTINSDSKIIEWQEHSGVHVFDWEGDLTRWQGRGIDALSTPNHRWLTAHRNRDGYSEWESPGRFLTTDELRSGHRNKQIITGGGVPHCFATFPTFSDEFVELVGWAVTEGHYQKPPARTGVLIGQSETANPEKVERIRRLVKYFADQGATATEQTTHRKGKNAGARDFYFGRGIGEHLRRVAPDKRVTPEFLCALTYSQGELLYETMLDGDGHRHTRPGRNIEQEFFIQKDPGLMGDFQALAAMLGKRTALHPTGNRDDVFETVVYHTPYTTNRLLNVSDEHYSGIVWCPSVPNGTVLARRNGSVYWTGQTYTEIVTEQHIEEYINDELLDSRDNPLGVIPVVHIANVPVAGSPWGLADVSDIYSLNKEYNEKVTDISDIINYHCVDPETEVLTRSGWKRYYEVCVADEILALQPGTDEIVWQPIEALNVFDYSGPMVQWNNRVDALTTPNHRWLAQRKIGRTENMRYERQFVRTSVAQDGDPAAGDLREGSRIILGGGIPNHFPTEPKYSDEFVETVGWFITEGWFGKQGTSTRPIGILSQSETKNPRFVADIRRLQFYWKQLGMTFTEQVRRDNGVICWYLGADLTELILDTVPGKSLPPEFLVALTYSQAERLMTVLIDADGNRDSTRVTWYQDDARRIDGFQMLSGMLQGARTRASKNNRGNGVVDCYQTRTVEILSTVNSAKEVLNESGVVWCPTVAAGVWFARRNGYTYWTGNSAPVTIITGAKATQLEKGPKKVWGGLPKDASVFNLELGDNLSASLNYLDMLKRSMHELTGVPQGALGEMQSISNTSGVALALTYLPLMNKYALKKTQYSVGFERINEIILKQLAIKEPELFEYDELDGPPLQEGNLTKLSLDDPRTYKSFCHWEPPLPTDVLVKLNEVQGKMGLGLESKVGALRELGADDPHTKSQEIFDELRKDALDQGALDLIRAQIQVAIGTLTGGFGGEDTSGGGGGPEDTSIVSAGGSEVTNAGNPQESGPFQGTQIQASDEIQGIINELTTLAFGTKLAQRRNPENQ